MSISVSFAPQICIGCRLSIAFEERRLVILEYVISRQFHLVSLDQSVRIEFCPVRMAFQLLGPPWFVCIPTNYGTVANAGYSCL